MGAIFAAFSDPKVFAHEEGENQVVLYEQAARVEMRREAALARAVFLAVRYADGVDPQTKKGVTLEQFLRAEYPDVL